VTYESTKPALVCMCLNVIGAYISWIDIGLIANERFVPVLLRFLSQTLLRETTCDCIHEIIIKGMDPVAKTKLIESFTEVLNSAGLLSLHQLQVIWLVRSTRFWLGMLIPCFLANRYLVVENRF